MKPRKLTMFAIVAAMLATLTSASPVFAAAANVLNVNVNHGINGQGVDQPFGHVTVCTPGTNNCQRIGRLLIDTASFGLRIFAQALTVPLPAQKSGPDAIGECVLWFVHGVGESRDSRRQDGRRADDFKSAGADHQSPIPFRGTSSRGVQPNRRANSPKSLAGEFQWYPGRGAGTVRLPGLCLLDSRQRLLRLHLDQLHTDHGTARPPSAEPGRPAAGR